jgi:hypothetical protein
MLMLLMMTQQMMMIDKITFYFQVWMKLGSNQQVEVILIQPLLHVRLMLS